MACQQSKTSVMYFLRPLLWLRLWPCGSTLCGTRRDLGYMELINEAAVDSLLELAVNNARDFTCTFAYSVS